MFLEGWEGKGLSAIVMPGNLQARIIQLALLC
jgi:hypothetical protein